VKPESAYTKVAFNLVKLLDGRANTAAHESGEVIKMIEEAHFKRVGEDASIETSVGTIGVVTFQKKQ